jgi:hypothetical protein
MINFKKSIVLTMMVSILAPQVAFACKDDASCQPAVNDRIDTVIRDASKKLPSSIREEFINILYQALTKKYKGECFINNKAAIAGGVVAGVVVGIPALVSAASAELTAAVAALITIGVSAGMIGLNGVGPQGSTTIGGKIANDPALQKQVTQVCNKIAKKLGTHFYAKSGACWGNSTNAKLKFKLSENMIGNRQIIDLNGKDDGITGANPAASP